MSLTIESYVKPEIRNVLMTDETTRICVIGALARNVVGMENHPRIVFLSQEDAAKLDRPPANTVLIVQINKFVNHAIQRKLQEFNRGIRGQFVAYRKGTGQLKMFLRGLLGEKLEEEPPPRVYAERGSVDAFILRNLVRDLHGSIAAEGARLWRLAQEVGLQTTEGYLRRRAGQHLARWRRSLSPEAPPAPLPEPVALPEPPAPAPEAPAAPRLEPAAALGAVPGAVLALEKLLEDWEGLLGAMKEELKGVRQEYLKSRGGVGK